jgi:hypothetical protein
MNYQEEVDKIMKEAEQRLETLENVYRLQQKYEADGPYKGDWCFFWDNIATFESGEPVTVGRFLRRASNGYSACNSLKVWDHCRKAKLEDFGWKLNKPDWKDAPDWAQYLAQDNNDGWWWFEKEPDKSKDVEAWDICIPFGGKYQKAAYNTNWLETLESRPE